MELQSLSEVCSLMQITTSEENKQINILLGFDVDVRTCSVLCVEISLTITPSHRAGSMILAKAITFFLVESIPEHSEGAKKKSEMSFY